MRSIIIILTLVICSCNNGGNNRKVPPEDSSGQTIDQVKAQKPKFEGFHPKPYILGQDTSYIRIIANRNILQKAWMVYYDALDNKWRTITWVGLGEDNNIIGDTIFTRKNGLVNGTSTADAPLFYTAYSLDSGKTWEPHYTYEAFYQCKYDNVRRSFNTTILVSNDYINSTGRPGVAIIIQNRKQSNFHSSGIEAQKNFNFFCPVTRQLPPYISQ